MSMSHENQPTAQLTRDRDRPSLYYTVCGVGNGGKRDSTALGVEGFNGTLS